MESENSNLREKANRILKEYKIFTLSNEKEIIEKLTSIADGENNDLDINGNLNDKIIENIESYLKIKEKMMILNEDYNFLIQLAKSLREQETRKTDMSNPPLFKIINSIGEEEFYLTRNALEEYNKVHKDDNRKIIGISKENSTELSELIEIIKRNF